MRERERERETDRQTERERRGKKITAYFSQLYMTYNGPETADIN
jgi:hypothetical protein